MAFDIKRGTNISYWLSQSQRCGDARRTWFTREDVRRLAEWGFDHLLTEGGMDREGLFHKVPRFNDSRLAELFAREVLDFLVHKQLLSHREMQVEDRNYSENSHRMRETS